MGGIADIHSPSFHDEIPVLVTAGFLVATNDGGDRVVVRELTVTRIAFTFVWEITGHGYGPDAWDDLLLEVRTEDGWLRQGFTGIRGLEGIRATAGLMTGPDLLTMPTSVAPIPQEGSITFCASSPARHLTAEPTPIVAARLKECVERVMTVGDAPVGEPL